MNESFNIRNLSAADRWIFCGNVLAIFGSLAVAIGSVMRLAAGGAMPSGQPIFTNSTGANHGNNVPSGTGRARDYFGV